MTQLGRKPKQEAKGVCYVGKKLPRKGEWRYGKQSLSLSLSQA